ncbi:hypothetical protein ACH47X_26160 [Promicromonospora kroppenstedtii]|uniref:Secreted protein n=1 Tax=Promicromonospora kroppenstedtii TaxID=440482 RepID=A0ABW7XSA6_9MICO
MVVTGLVLGTAATVAGLATLAPAGAVQPAAVPAEVAADELPPFAVEDFDYPGADQILEEQGFLLKRGDGHIVLADCTGDNLLEVGVRGLSSPYVCFRVTGDEGYLTLELPRAYSVSTNDYATTEITTNEAGVTNEYEFGPNELFRGIGEGAGGAEAMLLEIRVSR